MAALVVEMKQAQEGKMLPGLLVDGPEHQKAMAKTNRPEILIKCSADSIALCSELKNFL